jgi:alcohol dehydrogenase (NADP+)
MVFPIPGALESHLMAPMTWGGLTVYSPIKRFTRLAQLDGRVPNVGFIVIGGLGHMAIMISKAMGANTAFSRGNSEKEDAIKMGAHGFVATGEQKDILRNTTIISI